MGNVTLKFTIHAREFVKIVCASEEDSLFKSQKWFKSVIQISFFSECAI